MSAKPAYFEPIRERSAKRWEQLDSDPELAAPWHQLFKQVQSPRHILSELLQNADDAHATEASVEILDGCFLFSHNGEDFTEEHFASLCRFGYSNKRALHTIGFRGIGFKSTFSLGERVELYTPTLSIGFDQKRFTEPFWMNGSGFQRDRTTVRVAISDEHRETEVKKNLEEWLKSPVSLLFFRNIRRITINGKEVHWGSFGAGPVDGTEWLALHEKPDKKFLLARSTPENFPEDALREIRQERLLGADQDMAMPPCQVEIVVGVEGRLFVVLPTGVKTDLPFACNAPFIQDPARLKIKDPETSPTNRWLLERAGRLAADVMLDWLGNTKLHPEERASAYDMMPDVDRSSNALDGVCGAIVEKSFEDAIQDKDLLLTDNGHLSDKNQTVVLPKEIFEVWPQEQATALFDEQGREPLSKHITTRNITKLKNWDAVDEIDNQEVLDVLQKQHFPKPSSWRQLLKLWAYLDKLIQSYDYACSEDELRIVPVQSKDILLAASEVVRLGEKRIVPSDEDWAFLGNHLSVFNQNWMRFLAEQRRIAENEKNKELHQLTERAQSLLEAIGLDDASDTGKVIDQVAEAFFATRPVQLGDAVRLAHVAAKLGAQIGEHFKFVCQDKRLRPISKTVVYNEDDGLELLLPDEWAEQHLLHADYSKQFRSCSKEEWDAWVGSGRAGLKNFVPLERNQSRIWNEMSLQRTLKARGYTSLYKTRYSNPSFMMSDWDFGSEFWGHWDELEDELPAVWSRVVDFVLAAPSQWTNFLSATVSEIASNGHERRFIRDGLAPKWLAELREKPCLPDTNGTYRKPTELLMRTPDTEALMDVEAFVHGRLDSEATRPLLKLLGVSDKPTGPEKILQRLKGLAQAQTPPAHEVEKWYRRLDQLIDSCSTAGFQSTRETFESDRLILTEGGSWENTFGVFLSGVEEGIPDIPLVRVAVRDLTLWRKIGVGERPTAELAVEWLRTLPAGTPLKPDVVRRVKTLVSRYPKRIWDDCGHWLNLAGEWVPTNSFAYALSMQTLTRWSHLHQWVRQKTADLQMLSAELNETEPFNSLPPLAAQIEERFDQHGQPSGQRAQLAWLKELGLQLRRIKLDNEQEALRIRELAIALSRTLWLTSRRIEIIPYIDGKPAGTARQANALWLGDTLYAEEKPLAKLAKAVAQELGKAFQRQDIGDAIKLCFDRNPAFVRSFMEENFELLTDEELGDHAMQTGNDISDRPTESDAEDHASSGWDNDSTETDASSDVKSDDVDASQTSEAVVEDEAAEEDEQQGTQGEADADSEEDIIYRPVKPRHAKPQLIERFAIANGFKKDEDGHFFADDGRTIAKAHGSLFPWELRSVTGDVTKRFLPKEHCLERDPLQLGADIWGVLEREPDSYALILADPDDKPVEASGKMLNELRDRGVLALHPSTYRLVIEHEK
jgi:hypothetical protein